MQPPALSHRGADGDAVERRNLRHEVAILVALGGIKDPKGGVDVPTGLPGSLHHRLVQLIQVEGALYFPLVLASSFWWVPRELHYASSVHEHSLRRRWRVWPWGEQGQAQDTLPCCLRLRRHDRDLDANELVDQGRFPRVGHAEDADLSAAFQEPGVHPAACVILLLSHGGLRLLRLLCFVLLWRLLESSQLPQHVLNLILAVPGRA
mmetsp:Transcript_651/g.1562  ORF Transcript_651/g.1562 Transcript_651/m.1562 type:complete len:207 (+) Transcript_651:842-1462(+)